MSDKIKSHCNKCGDVWHDVLHTERTSWKELIDGQIEMMGADDYILCKCCGCDGVSLRHETWFSEDTDEYGEPYTKVSYFPPAISRRPPKWLGSLKMHLGFSEEEPIQALITEIYAALHNNSRRLAAMGIRSLLEQVMTDKVGKHATFKGMTDTFEKAGYLSEKQKQVLQTILEATHAATHRAFIPTKADLEALLDITESIIEMIYLHEAKAKKLGTRIPIRERPLKASKA